MCVYNTSFWSILRANFWWGPGFGGGGGVNSPCHAVLCRAVPCCSGGGRPRGSATEAVAHVVFWGFVLLSFRVMLCCVLLFSFCVVLCCVVLFLVWFDCCVVLFVLCYVVLRCVAFFCVVVLCCVVLFCVGLGFGLSASIPHE